MELIILFVLILLNGFFSMSEIAILSVKKSKLDLAARKGDKIAKRVLDLADHPNRFLSTVQIGITLIGILTGVYSGDKLSEQLILILNEIPLLQPYSQVISVLTVVILITYLSLVLGELVPKRIGLAHSESIARFAAKPMSIISQITAPFIWILSSSSDLLMNVFKLNNVKEEQVTEEEIKAIVYEGMEAGSIQKIEQHIIDRVFHLGDRKAASLMTPVIDMVWLNVNKGNEFNKNKIINSMHSVFPVCNGSTDNILGVVSIKDVLKGSLENKPFDLKSYITAPLYIPENMLAYNVLENFKESRKNFALVTDEFGSAKGVITINDLMVVLLGSISDIKEHEDEIILRADGSYLVDATISIRDFLLAFNIEDEELMTTTLFHSLGGFIIAHYKAIPKTGFSFIWKEYSFEVLDMDGVRIDKVLVKKLGKVK